jgi:exodeoxyribonuclease VII large subunit
LIVVARGGGSIEDLMAFNEEIVVRAAAESAIPLISAVGHETDTTLIDLAADRRAPTPTAAAEIAVPVRAELLSQTLEFERRATTCFLRGIAQRQTHLAAMARVLPRTDQVFAQSRQRLDYVSDHLGRALLNNLQIHRRALSEAAGILRPGSLLRQMSVCSERVAVLHQRLLRRERARLFERQTGLDSLTRMLESVSYRNVLDRGFALVRSQDGALKRRAANVVSGEELILTFADESTSAVAIGPPRQPLHRSGRPKKLAKEQGNLF